MYVGDFYKKLKEGNRYLRKTLGEIRENQEKILNEEFPSLYERIAITESNLNYYNMIHRIMTENEYVNLELLINPSLAGRNILLAGFWGAYNLGDELMLQTVLKYLKNGNYGNITILLCDNNDYDYGDFPDVQFIHYPKNRFDYNILAQKFDALIWGGGALIDDAQYEHKNKVDYLGNMLVDLSKRFLAFHKKCIMLGLSANRELKDKCYVKGIVQIIDQCDFFSVRDRYSKRLLVELGADEKKIELLNDIVFAETNWALKPKWEKKCDKEVKIGIAFICLEETGKLLADILRILDRTCKSNVKYRVCLLPFYEYNKNDSRFYCDIVGGLDFHTIEVELCEYVNSFDEIAEKFQEMDCFINMRYHAMLLSMVLGIPSVNIVLDTNPHYYNKMFYLAELGRYTENIISLSEATTEKLEKMIEEIVVGDKRPVIDCEILSQTQMQIQSIFSRVFKEAENENINSFGTRL